VEGTRDHGGLPGVEVNGVGDGEDAANPKANKEPGAEGAVGEMVKAVHDEGGDGEEAKEGDPEEVGDLEGRGAVERVVDGGVAGADDHEHDADVVALVPGLGDRVGVTGEEVKEAAEEEAGDGAGEEEAKDDPVKETGEEDLGEGEGSKAQEEDRAKEVAEGVARLVVDEEEGPEARGVREREPAVPAVDPGVVLLPVLELVEVAEGGGLQGVKGLEEGTLLGNLVVRRR